jgi:hypothetical protein
VNVVAFAPPVDGVKLKLAVSVGATVAVAVFDAAELPAEFDAMT